MFILSRDPTGQLDQAYCINKLVIIYISLINLVLIRSLSNISQAIANAKVHIHQQ